MRTIRLGIVGCGEVGRHVHLPVLARVAQVDVVAVADPDPARLASAGEVVREAGRYADADALMGDPGVEAVAVLVPPAAHRSVAAAVLAAGKPLFVEKPLAVTLDDADDLVTRGDRAGLPAMVGFNLRWLPALRRARDLV